MALRIGGQIRDGRPSGAQLLGCLAEPGKQYAVYFPDGGAVKLDVSAAAGPLQVRRLDIASSAWREPQAAAKAARLELKTPAQGQWAVLILLQE